MRPARDASVERKHATNQRELLHDRGAHLRPVFVHVEEHAGFEAESEQAAISKAAPDAAAVIVVVCEPCYEHVSCRPQISHVEIHGRIAAAIGTCGL
jgi:hypothetical protein